MCLSTDMHFAPRPLNTRSANLTLHSIWQACIGQSKSHIPTIKEPSSFNNQRLTLWDLTWLLKMAIHS